MIRTALTILAVAACAAPALAQQDLSALLEQRAKSVPDGPRTFQETWLLPASGTSAAGPEATRFAGRVHVWQRAPRERLEIRPVAGDGLGDPIILVLDGDRYLLLTPVGATPFLESAPAGDSFVRMVLAGPPGEAPPHRTIPADGGVAAVVLRHAGPEAFDPEEAFATEPVRGGRGLLSGLSDFSAAGDAEVVASAGARGVEQIRTASGTIAVTPDPVAVEWMESEAAVPVLELERFRREARLSPYDLLPPETAPAAEEGR